jgi:hypothetical protein
MQKADSRSKLNCFDGVLGGPGKHDLCWLVENPENSDNRHVQKINNPTDRKEE